MQIIRGTVPCALKVVLYGPEGIGKSTFASQFPNPVFIDTEGSTVRMDVARTSRPNSFTALKGQIQYFIDHSHELDTLIIDTADWAERLCIEEVCAKRDMKSIEDAGYGKGYTYVAEEFGKMLNLLDELIIRGVHVVLTAHAKMRKFEQPDELGAYDRWELKLGKSTAPLLKEWSDLLLFANYKTMVVNVDNQGAAKGKNKVQGGRRVMYTSHHPCWDAKNRFSLAEELPFEYAQIAHIVPMPSKPEHVSPPPIPQSAPVSPPAPTPAPVAVQTALTETPINNAQTQGYDPGEAIPDKALLELMTEANVTGKQVREAIAFRGYWPASTPIAQYSPEFVRGCLIGAWPTVLEVIRNMDVPF